MEVVACGLQYGITILPYRAQRFIIYRMAFVVLDPIHHLILEVPRHFHRNCVFRFRVHPRTKTVEAVTSLPVRQ